MDQHGDGRPRDRHRGARSHGGAALLTAPAPGPAPAPGTPPARAWSARSLALALGPGPTLALALALALTPVVAAAPPDFGPELTVHLVETRDGYWAGESSIRTQESSALVWVPEGARIEGVENASWSAAGPDALRLVPTNGTSVVRFDWRPSPFTLARIVAPQDYARLVVEVAPAGGDVPQGEGLAFDPVVGGYAGSLAPVHQGDVLVVRSVDPERVGEVPLLLVVGGLALVTLLGGLLWHRVRPALEGKAPEKFLDHLVELQARLTPPAIAFALLNLLYFGGGLRVAHWNGFTFLAPTVSLQAGFSTRAFEAMAERLVPASVELVALRPVEAVLVQVQMGLFLAVATVLPLLLYELAAFVGPALSPRERGMASRSIPVVLALALAGAVFGYLVMAPFMLNTLYGYAPSLGARALLGVSDLVSFALLIVAAFAFAFELPVVMYALSRLGVVKAATFRKYARHAIVVIAIVAGIITPDPSVVSQLVVAVPVTGLYLVGLAAAAIGERRRSARSDAAAVST